MDMQINFPNLGIFLEHVGKNFSVFGFEIAFYGITMATGILVGYLIAAKEAKRIPRKNNRVAPSIRRTIFDRRSLRSSLTIFRLYINSV